MFNKETAIRVYNDTENKVDVISLVGNLVQDPVLRTIPTKKGDMTVISAYTGEDKKRKSMTVATKERDRKEEETVYIDYEIWGKGAEVFAQYAKTGTQVYMHGRYTEEPWTTTAGKEGVNRTLVVESFRLLNSKGEKVESTGAPRESKSEFTTFQPVDDEDIPF